MFEDSTLWVVAGLLLLFVFGQGSGSNVLGLGLLGLLGFLVIGEAQHH